MAKIDLKFLDCRNDFQNISVKINKCNQISIIIRTGESLKQICLDKSTSIKFAKTLRTEINKITESEVKDGRK